MPTIGPPSLLVYYHIPKTGGSSTREWLLRNAGVRARGLPARLNGIVRYYEAQCFFCLQLADALGADSGCEQSVRRKCAGGFTKRPASFDFERGNWLTAGALAVEFHGPSEAIFIEHVLPRAHALRELYAKRNGTCKFATIIREPIDFLFSSYHMWPPRPLQQQSSKQRRLQRPQRAAAAGSSTTAVAASSANGITAADADVARAVVVAFPRWVRSAPGLQTAFLTSPSCVAVSRADGHRNKCGSDPKAVGSAATALAQFDVVGVTACLSSFFDSVATAMRFSPPDTPSARHQRRARGGNASAGLLQAQPRCGDCSALENAAHARWSWDGLSAVQRRTALEVASYDERIYRLALPRAAKEWPGAAECNPPERERSV